MDTDRFDCLLRSLTVSPSRRGIVRTLAGLTIGGGWGAVLRSDDTVAKKKRKKKRKKRKNKSKQASPPPPPDSPPPSVSPPPPPPCIGSCAGKVCGDDRCGGSCGACAGGSVCEGGQCVATCCDAGTSCFEDGYCTCETSGSDYCSCPADDRLCHGAQCCLAGDACIAPVDVFDGERRACFTQTCQAGNDICQYEFAFCGDGSPGSCGCFTHASGEPLCAALPPPDEHYCPTFTECVEDGDCAEGKVCANVWCCNPGVEPFVGRCVTPCP